MSDPRVVVTGAGAQLGRFIVRAFDDCEVMPLTRADLDVADPEAVRAVVARLSPSLIVNCAAFNAVDAAEDDAPAAFAVNAFAVRSLARAADATGAVLVHYSSDFVFDGQAARPYLESDPPRPRSVYASSKLVGEWFARDAARAFVLRAESLFGCDRDWRGRRGTLDQIVERMEAGEEVRVFSDRVVSPSYLADVAAATRHLVEAEAAPGLYHCVNGGPASWYEVARDVASQLRLAPRLVSATIEQVPMKAERPRYCALDNAKLAGAGFAMPPWPDAVGRWLASRGDGPASAGPPAERAQSRER